MKKISIMRRVGAFLVAGAVALGTSSAALAADSVDFDAAKKGSITVHKHYGDPMKGAKSNGKEETVTNEPLSGVKFKVEKVNNVDLTKNAGWADAEKVHAGTLTPTFDAPTEKTTGPDGTAKFDQLAVGLYRVTEVDVNGAKKADGTPVSVKMAAPFYVTVPLTDPDNRSKWLYDIHVYPKNQSFKVEKTSSVIAGNQMRYTVVATLPKLEEGKKYEKYNLIDKLSENHDLTTFTLEKVEAIAGKEDKNPTNIELTNLEVDKNSGASKNVVYARFTKPTGLGELDKVSAAGKTEIRYTYTVKIKDTLKAGDLSNDAYIAPSNDYSDEPKDGTPHSENKKKFVQFQVEKQDSSDKAKKLEGAEFELYACNKDGKFLTPDGQVTADKSKANKLSGDAPIVTKAGGKTDAIRIPVADSKESDIQKVCAVETKAPNGYTLLTEPVSFEVSYKEGTETTPIVHAIDNVQDNAGWKLPSTGANALIVLTIAGVLLIAGSILIPMTHRSKKDTK